MARIGFAATAPFGADVLTRLATSHELAFCLTRPDRPAGRGRQPMPPPAKTAAEGLGIPVLQPELLDGEVDLPADVIITCAYGVIVPPVLLARQLWLNVHPSLLPRWRGAAPVERAIMAGDRETGVSIIKLVEELDAGPIAAQRMLPIAPDDDAGTIYREAAAVAVELLEEVLDRAVVHTAARRRRDVRGEGRSRRPRGRPRRRSRGRASPDPGVVSAHRRPRDARRARGHDLVARVSRTGASFPSTCSPRTGGG